MIEAKDLRIGNLLRNTILDEIVEVGIDELKFALGINFNKHFEPIPLTEEWLINFGFEKKKITAKVIKINIVYFQYKGIIVYLLKDFFEIEIQVGKDQFNLFRQWNYVHELQNVYFIFNKTELQLKQ